MKLKITRHENGQIKTIGLVEEIVNRYGGLDDEFAPAVEHKYGPFFGFDENGCVRELAEYSDPKMNPKYYPAEVYQDDLCWSKTFNAQGQVDKVIGRPNEVSIIGWFELNEDAMTLFKTLKKEKLIPAVEKVCPRIESFILLDIQRDKAVSKPKKIATHKGKTGSKNLARVKE